MSSFDSNQQTSQSAFSAPNYQEEANPPFITSEIIKAKPVVLEPELVDPRTIWGFEVYFSAWLRENIDMLGKAIGIHLSAVEREQKAGSFKVDLVAFDDQHNPVIIENQLERTDHIHMGQIITYVASFGAKTAIWITSDPREEHKKAVMWLNESTPEDTSFYLIKLEVYRIGNSEPGLFFRVIAGPTTEAKEIGKERSNISEGIQQSIRLRFWEQLLHLAKQGGIKTHNNTKATGNSWIGVGGKLRYCYRILARGKPTVELWIHTGSEEENKRIFDKLYARKQEVEQSFGGSLAWERLDDGDTSRIRFYIPDGSIQNEDEWPSLQTKMINDMDRLHKALKPYVDNLPKKDVQDSLDNPAPAVL
jgi:Domain of unknown function (DUF4268)